MVINHFLISLILLLLISFSLEVTDTTAATDNTSTTTNDTTNTTSATDEGPKITLHKPSH